MIIFAKSSTLDVDGILYPPQNFRAAIFNRKNHRVGGGGVDSAEIIWSFFPVQFSWWVRWNRTDLKKAFLRATGLLNCS